ncbi:MAG TPA: ATP-binding cassette domain-containing protein [Candidatus Dormibacteraeota bacterium]|nr:ATP-binding cassette domain-containing protein [Candidatus Dormibacteraeota bacterium]
MIRLENVTKQFASGSNAVRDLSLEIPDGVTCVLIGPSGCGKTTTLRMINRLIDPDHGRVIVDGVDTHTVDPAALRLKMGYVIQQTGLFPHMTIGGNVGTVPRLWNWDRRRIAKRVDELLELVGLPPAEYRDRYPHQLSGGQRQRVGFARALAADPPILLMDEPFGAVDRITRERLQQEFISIQRSMRKTVVFVTHDIDEAVIVGDRICLLKMQAEIAQYDTPEKILTRPASEYVAEFLGRERLVRRMSVVRINPQTLDRPDGGPGAGEPRVPLSSTLTEAFAAALSSPTERAAVFDGDRYAGAFTATSLLESLRRESVEGGDNVAAGV